MIWLFYRESKRNTYNSSKKKKKNYTHDMLQLVEYKMKYKK